MLVSLIPSGEARGALVKKKKSNNTREQLLIITNMYNCFVNGIVFSKTDIKTGKETTILSTG